MDIVTFDDFYDLNKTYGDYPTYVVRYTRAVNQGPPPPPMLDKGAYYANLKEYHRLVRSWGKGLSAYADAQIASQIMALKKDLLL